MKYLLASVAISLSFIPGAARADSPLEQSTQQPLLDLGPRPYTYTAYWENDSSFLKRNNAEDRHYTNGMAVTFSHRPEWAEGFADEATLGEVFDRTAAGYILGQLMFTPELIQTRRLIRGDRPYAGYLFAGVYLQRANDHVFDHAQLDLGVVGPSSFADSLQKNTHDLFDAEQPRGWDNQLRDEFTAQLTLRRKWRYDLQDAAAFDTTFEHQVIPYLELGIGTFSRHAAAGATYRLGFNLSDDFGPGRLADPIDATSPQPNHTGGYGFVRATGRAVEHDLLLEGNTYKSSHGVNAKTLVGELQAGLAIQYHYEGWQLEAGYAQTFITEQFNGQQGSDSFGAVSASISRGF